jgi:DNA mismatch repair protein MutH
MKLQEGFNEIEKIVGIPLGQIFEKAGSDIGTANKGSVGQLLEKTIGLSNTNFKLDFEDGELKTNKCKVGKNGEIVPMETLFLRQIASEIDTFVGEDSQPFEDTSYYDKMQNLLYVPICKESKNPADWYVMGCFNIQTTTQSACFEQLNSDWDSIRAEMRESCLSEGTLHTSSGKYIQTRTKDSQPYTPIISSEFNEVSNKNRAVYFQKKFMVDIISGVIDSNQSRVAELATNNTQSKANSNTHTV